MVWAAFRLYPKGFLLSGGHPDLNYYAYSFGHWCYSDVVALYAAHKLFLHQWPYFQTRMEYPVVIGAFMSSMALLPGFMGYFVGSWLGLLCAMAVAFWAVSRARGVRRALWWSASPLLLVYGALNWDVLGIACWGLSVLAFERGRYRGAGLWIGVGVATKFFPLVLLPYLAMSLYRRETRGHRQDFRQLLWGFLVTALGINLPVVVGAFRGWSYFFTFNSGRAPDPGVFGWLRHLHLLTIADVNGVSLLVTFLGGSFLLYGVYRGRLEPLHAATAALAWWFLCNKVYSPQYMLWVYYALLWVDTSPMQLVVTNLVGLMDFGLAMQWLALGTTGSPFLTDFVSRWATPVIAMRDLALFGASVNSLAKLSTGGRSRPPSVHKGL